MADSGGFTALKQPTLKGSKDCIMLWDIKEPQTIVLHRKLREIIALDYQYVDYVECIRFFAALKHT